jgi:hypothetical protein
VLGRLGGVDGETVGAGDHDCGHPIGPPDPRRATQRNEHPVYRLREVPKGHLLALVGALSHSGRFRGVF